MRLSHFLANTNFLHHKADLSSHFCFENVMNTPSVYKPWRNFISSLHIHTKINSAFPLFFSKMSMQVFEDVPMVGNDDAAPHQGPLQVPPRARGPRIIIDTSDQIPVRSHPDATQDQPAFTFDWADEKEAQIASQERKLRRQEIKKAKRAVRQSELTGKKSEIANAESMGEPEAPATNTPKVPAAVAPPKAKSGSQKRKTTADDRETPKKRVASTEDPSKSGDVKHIPPIKRSDMSQKQRSAHNKAKREGQKLKKKGKAKAKEEAATEEEEKKAAEEASGAMSKYPLLINFLCPRFK